MWTKSSNKLMNINRRILIIEIQQFFYFIKIKLVFLLLQQLAMEGGLLKSPNNSGQLLKLQIRQKSTYIKKRKVKTWSPEQDQQLTKLCKMHPKKWGIIASLMFDRNQNQCLHRYRRLSQLGAHKKIWSAEEDQTILSLIKKVGKNWKLLAQIIGTKTGKQIRQRFINKLDPQIKTDQWTDEQDKLILKYYSQLGSKWSEISKKLPGRPQNKIKNRFYSYIQKNYDIKYVYVDSNSIQSSGYNPIVKQINVISKKESQKKETNKYEKQILEDDLIRAVSHNLKLNMDLRIQEQEISNQNQNEQPASLKQIDLNKRVKKSQQLKKSKNINNKKIKRTYTKPKYSRFKQYINNQNIYQDDLQENQQAQDESSKQAKGKQNISKGNNIKQRVYKLRQKNKQKQCEELPSIKQLQDQFKISHQANNIGKAEAQNINSMQNCYNFNNNYNYGEQKDQIFDSNVNLQGNQKYYIKSLIRVQDEIVNHQNRYRSIRDLVSNNQIQNHQNQLFYLSHN